MIDPRDAAYCAPAPSAQFEFSARDVASAVAPRAPAPHRRGAPECDVEYHRTTPSWSPTMTTRHLPATPYQPGDKIRALCRDEGGRTRLGTFEVARVAALPDGISWRVGFRQPAAEGRSYQGGLVDVVVDALGQDQYGYVSPPGLASPLWKRCG